MAPQQVSVDTPHKEEAPKTKTFMDLVFDYSLPKFNRSLYDVTDLPSINQRITLALEFIQLECTARYGWLTMVAPNMEMTDIEISIPNVFDTVIIVDILQSYGASLSPIILTAIKEQVKDIKFSDGVWNFFYRKFNYIPDDIDTSGNIIVVGKRWLGDKPSETKEYVQKLLEVCTIYEDHLPDTYILYPNLPKPENPPVGEFPVRRRVDLGTVTNFLYCLIQTEVEHLPELENSYAFLEKALDSMIGDDGDDGFLRKFAKSYENWDIVTFFISRLVPISSHARALYQDKLIHVLKNRCVGSVKDDILSLASRILAAFNVGILEDECGFEVIAKDLERLLALQNLETFAFPVAPIYNAHYKYYFGSSAFSTAMATAALSVVRDSRSKLQHYSNVIKRFVSE